MFSINIFDSSFSDVLAIDPTSVRSNIDVAKIYSSILPHQYRDNEFAMICIERALLFHPNSSKANHRMASFLISTVSNLLDLTMQVDQLGYRTAGKVPKRGNSYRNNRTHNQTFSVCIQQPICHKGLTNGSISISRNFDEIVKKIF